MQPELLPREREILAEHPRLDGWRDGHLFIEGTPARLVGLAMQRKFGFRPQKKEGGENAPDRK